MFKKDDVIRVVRVNPINIAWMSSAKQFIGKVGVVRYPDLKVSVVEIDGRLHWLYNSEIEIDETNQKLEPGNLSGLFYVKGS